MTREATPTFSEVLESAIERGIENMHVALPASVEEYDASKQCISARPLIKRGYQDEENERQTEELGIVNDVPVVFPGGGGFRVTFPIKKGDTVLLVFSESSLDAWLQGGGCVDPQDDRRNALSDAIAIPGLRSFNNALSDAPTSVMSVGKDGGATASFDETEIRLGSDSASDPVALKSDLEGLRTWLATHTHSGVTTGPGISGVPATLPVTSTPGASKVKAE